MLFTVSTQEKRTQELKEGIQLALQTLQWANLIVLETNVLNPKVHCEKARS